MGRRKDRLVVDSPVPIDVINAEEIQATGATQTVEVLQMLVPSYSAPKQSISDGSDHFRIATLRGLGPDQVLVLVNGKRRHTNALVHVNGTVGRGSTGVDMNAIPASSVERIEVLRDGAAAQYGSDAIAGALIIFLIGLELILGVTIFKNKQEESDTATIVPIAFPLIAGAGTMTTIISLKSNYETISILVGIVINVALVYLVLRSSNAIAKKIGKGGAEILRKVFGIILLAIAIKLFRENFYLLSPAAH